MTTQNGILVVRAAIYDAMHAGRAVSPRETGGILLGFRTPDTVVVTRALPVPDVRSTERSYLRQRHRAHAKMAAVQRDVPSVVGYVGEWHTHPENQGPSRTDLRVIGETARFARGPVGLIVISFPTTGPARAHGRVVSRRRTWPVAIIDPVDLISSKLTITNDTADSLEAEAATLIGSEEPHDRRAQRHSTV